MDGFQIERCGWKIGDPERRDEEIVRLCARRARLILPLVGALRLVRAAPTAFDAGACPPFCPFWSLISQPSHEGMTQSSPGRPKDLLAAALEHHRAGRPGEERSRPEPMTAGTHRCRAGARGPDGAAAVRFRRHQAVAAERLPAVRRAKQAPVGLRIRPCAAARPSLSRLSVSRSPSAIAGGQASPERPGTWCRRRYRPGRARRNGSRARS